MRFSAFCVVIVATQTCCFGQERTDGLLVVENHYSLAITVQKEALDGELVDITVDPTEMLTKENLIHTIDGSDVCMRNPLDEEHTGEWKWTISMGATPDKVMQIAGIKIDYYSPTDIRVTPLDSQGEDIRNECCQLFCDGVTLLGDCNHKPCCLGGTPPCYCGAGCCEFKVCPPCVCHSHWGLFDLCWHRCFKPRCVQPCPPVRCTTIQRPRVCPAPRRRSLLDCLFGGF